MFLPLIEEMNRSCGFLPFALTVTIKIYRQTALQMKNFYLYLTQVKTLCNSVQTDS